MSLRPTARSLAATLAAVLTLGLGACAGGVAAGGAAGTEAAAPRTGNTSVRVQNNLFPQATITVATITDAGVRTVLGTVEPGATVTLRFDTQSGSRLRFVAELPSGSPVRSELVTLSPGRSLRWDVSANALR